MRATNQAAGQDIASRNAAQSLGADFAERASIAEHLTYLATLAPGWDGGFGDALSPVALARAHATLLLLDADAEGWSVGPSADGSVFAEHEVLERSRGLSASLRFEASGEIAVETLVRFGAAQPTRLLLGRAWSPAAGARTVREQRLRAWEYLDLIPPVH